MGDAEQAEDQGNDHGEDQTDQQQVSGPEEDAAVERTRTKLIAEFAGALSRYNSDLFTNFTAALSSFETTARSSSAQEAKVDILGTVATVCFEEGVKAAIGQLGPAAPVAGVLFSLAK